MLNSVRQKRWQNTALSGLYKPQEGSNRPNLGSFWLPYIGPLRKESFCSNHTGLLDTCYKFA